MARHPRIAVPTVLQMEATECGAAALCSLLAHYGCHLPLEELRSLCGVTRDGSRAGNLVRAARSLGMRAEGLRLDRAGLEQCEFPLILYWEANHFVVLEGFAEGCAWINDPACGRRRVADEEFRRCYSGIVLELRPRPEFKLSGSAPAPLADFVRGLAPHKSACLFLLLAALVQLAPLLALPAFLQIFVDEFLIEERGDWLRPLLSGMLMLALLRGALAWLAQDILQRLELRMAVAAGAGFFWHVLRLPMRFFEQRFAGELGQRLAALDRSAHLSARLLAGAAGVPALLAGLLFLLCYDLQLAVPALCCMGLALSAPLLFSAPELQRLAQQEQGRYSASLTGALHSIESIKAAGAEHETLLRCRAQLLASLASTQALALRSGLLHVTPVILYALLFAGLLYAGGELVMQGELSLGRLVGMLGMLAAMQPLAASVAGVLPAWREAAVLQERCADVLRQAPDARFNAAPAGAAAADPAAGLELRELGFSHQLFGPALIDGLSLQLLPGARIGIVGASGSGKSTLARLLAGHYPHSGEILLGGVARPATHWQAWLAMVDQDIRLFDASVRDNICLWDSSLAEADMLRAAHDACIHEVIAARPGGYDGVVSAGGANFSAGQAQRIELARALARNPRFLVLDEATAALDTMTEARVLANLKQRGCGLLLIAHRDSALRDCDEILVLVQGRLVERGSHAALMARGGEYCRLMNGGAA